MNIKSTYGVLLCAVFICGVAGCEATAPETHPAELVLRGGFVHTVNNEQPSAESIAVSDGHIVFVGDNDLVGAYIGPDTQVVDLEGKLVLPGLVDAHVHPLGGSLRTLFECTFPFSATPDDVQQMVAACVDAQPDAQWILGGQWDSAFFDTYDIESPKAWLDAVSGNAAILLSDDSGHNAWVNSKALQLAGVTADTEEVPGGTIARDSDGVPNGVLLESAQGLIYSVVPKRTDDQVLEAARWFSDTANGFGITAVKAANIEEYEIRAFRAAEDNDTLNLHVATSIQNPYGHRAEPLDYDDIDRIRDTYASELVDTRYVKIFMDGVPTVARTAAMLSPYLPSAEHGDDFTGGPTHISKGVLAADLIELEKRGYTVKIHTAGDRAVRDALDAIATARDANGDTGLRHELAHAGYIHIDDLPRFAELDAVADLSPIIWHPSPIIGAVVAAVGKERGERYFPVRDLLDNGAPLLAGSDWPSAVPDANPWIGIEAFVSRKDPRDVTPGALWPEQAITLEEAIAIYTRHGARAIRLEDKIGSIEVGKLADLIVLEQNLFEIPIDAVSDTIVERTYFGGELAYARQ